MDTMASQITSLTIVYSTVYSDADQRKHQSSASLAFVRGIHRGPVNSPHKWPVTRKMFPFDDVIMLNINGGFAWPPLKTGHGWARHDHYADVIMTTIASQITSLTVVYSTVYSDADQRKHQSSTSLAFVWGIHRDRWIPRTKGQLRGKCFHLMTSSCIRNEYAQNQWSQWFQWSQCALNKSWVLSNWHTCVGCDALY